jgi:hypothetical protein
VGIADHQRGNKPEAQMTLTDAIEGNPCDCELCRESFEEYKIIARRYPDRQQSQWWALWLAAVSLEPGRLQ